MYADDTVVWFSQSANSSKGVQITDHFWNADAGK